MIIKGKASLFKNRNLGDACKLCGYKENDLEISP